MGQKNQDGITFNSVVNDDRAGTPISYYPIHVIGITGPDEDGGIINSVDIDWNGAQLSLPEGLKLGTTITINTTGQLLAAIKVA